MLPYSGVAVAVAIVIRIPMQVQNRRKNIKISVPHELLLYCYVGYFAGLFALALLLYPATSGLNLIPFHIVTVLGTNPRTWLIDLCGNVLTFVPVSFGMLLLYRVRYRTAFLTGAACSLFIEAVQLFLPRKTDIDDFLLNAAGALLGCVIFSCFRRFFPSAVAACKGNRATGS